MVRWLSAAVLSSLGLVAPDWILAQENSETKPPLPDVNELFQQLDANSDGQVADDEVSDEHSRLFKRLLRKADKDGDGKLSRAEFVAGLQEERPQPPADGRPNPQRNEGLRRFAQADPEQLFQRLDANGDDKLELEEMPEQAREGLRRFFEQADANRDKSLSLEELRKGQEYLRRLTGGARRRTRRPPTLRIEELDQQTAPCSAHSTPTATGLCRARSSLRPPTR